MSDYQGVSEYKRIRYSVSHGIATLLLNRPEKRNALDNLTLMELGTAFNAAGSDDDVRVVLLRGAGPDFCAGADLAQLERISASSDPLENLEDAAMLGELFIRMRGLTKPIVAVVHGSAFAGGAGLATACDLAIAADTAKLSYTEVRLGFVPAMVMALLRRIVGEKVAFELAALGEVITAPEAQRLGIFNRVVPAQLLDKAAHDYAVELTKR
ncbi:MAG: enoyl-CoA hydratase/isomerase family protein, partial [Gemmatimonadota bacterium]